MVAGLVQGLLRQGFGELVANFFLPLIPGPAIGLVMCLAQPRIRAGVLVSIDLVATAFSQNLELILRPGP